MHKFLYSIFFSVVALVALIISAPSASANDSYAESVVDNICTYYSLDRSDVNYIYTYTYRQMDNRIIVAVYPSDMQPSLRYGSGLYGSSATLGMNFQFVNGYCWVDDNSNFGYYSSNGLESLSGNINGYNNFVLPFNFYGSFSSVSFYPYRNDENLTESEAVLYLQDTPATSSVTGNSDMDLLNGLYNITFVPKSCSISNSSTDMMIDNIYECTLVPVRSDNGYNMLSIQCPALAQNQDIVYYGDFTFHLRKADTSISGGSLSFAVDLPSPQPDEPNFYIPISSYFKVKLLNPPPDGTLIDNSVSFTVNDFSFLNSSNSVCRYSSRSMLAFDYSGNDLYSLITFTGAVGSNMYSAGSFVYNFGYSDILKNGSSLPPEDIEKIKEEGRKHSDDTKRTTGYVPKYNGFPDTSTKFSTPNLTNYDFTSLADIFNSLFNDYVINMMMISVSVGIVGYILFGRGD